MLICVAPDSVNANEVWYVVFCMSFSNRIMILTFKYTLYQSLLFLFDMIILKVSRCHVRQYRTSLRRQSREAHHQEVATHGQSHLYRGVLHRLPE